MGKFGLGKYGPAENRCNEWIESAARIIDSPERIVSGSKADLEVWVFAGSYLFFHVNRQPNHLGRPRGPLNMLVPVVAGMLAVVFGAFRFAKDQI